MTLIDLFKRIVWPLKGVVTHELRTGALIAIAEEE